MREQGVRTRVRQNDLAYDVGMHKGEDTDFYLKKGFRVVGFEADPDLAEHCRWRFADALRDGRLVIVEGAIVDSTDVGGARTVRFFKNPGRSIWGTAAPDWAARNERMGKPSETIDIAAVDFAACLSRYGVPYYLKIDIEGMDTACLRALRTCTDRPAYVSVETEKVSFERLAADFDLLASLGYTAFKVVDQRHVPRQREPQPAREGRYADQRFPWGSSGLFGKDLPGRWRTHAATLRQYERIFTRYRLFGDDGALWRYPFGRLLRRPLCLFMGGAFPGWHDVHARHASVDEAPR